MGTSSVCPKHVPKRIQNEQPLFRKRCGNTRASSVSDRAHLDRLRHIHSQRCCTSCCICSKDSSPGYTRAGKGHLQEGTHSLDGGRIQWFTKVQQERQEIADCSQPGRLAVIRGFQITEIKTDHILPPLLPHSIPVLFKPLARWAGAMARASTISCP